MWRTPQRASAFALGAAFLVTGCNGGPREVAFVEPGPHAFVRDGDPIVVGVRARRQDELVLSIDGVTVEPGPVAGADGIFAAVAAAPAGRHRLVAEVPGVPGAADVRDVHVGRGPHAPVDGFGFAPGAAYALTLSDGKPGDGGLYEGRLAVFAIGTAGVGFHRVLSERGVSGEISGEGRVLWMDEWSGSRGTLHVAGLEDPEMLRLTRVRDASFGPDGRTVAALDDGVVVRPPSMGVRRVATSARAFVFSGPAGDLVTFDGEDGETARAITLVSAPDYDAPAVLAAPVLPLIASNPTRREAAFLEWREIGFGPLVLYDYAGMVATRPFESVAGLTWSRDGKWLLALADADSSGEEASLGLLRRPVGSALVLPGEFRKASFDRSSTRVFALEGGTTAMLKVAHLDDPIPSLVDLLAGVEEIASLPGDRMLLLLQGNEIAVVLPDDSVLELGAYNIDQANISVSRDGEVLAFTAVDGERRPIRRVDFVTGHIGDLGQDARRPAALADGALAWAENVPGADPEAEELWLFPRFPASFSGARRLKSGIDVGRPFPVSPDGEWISVVAGGRSLCVGAAAHVRDLGAVDAQRHDSFFLADGQLGRFGGDGSEKRVLFLQSCGE